MPNLIFVVLGAMGRLGFARPPDIACVSGYCESSFWHAKVKLLQLGWIDRPQWGRYYITERGKIALAIETGRRTKHRGNIKTITFKEFIQAA